MRLTLAEFLAVEARLNGRTRISLDAAKAAESEASLHNEIIEHCRAKGWIYFNGSMAHKTKRTLGEPDFTLLLPHGRVLFIECKGKNTKTSPGQLAMEAWMKNLGHTMSFVRSFEEFLKLVA